MGALPITMLAERKGRGAFFTPPEITRFLANWAIRTSKDAVLEPSCGEAAFLVSAAQRLQVLGAGKELASLLHGTDGRRWCRALVETPCIRVANLRESWRKGISRSLPPFSRNAQARFVNGPN